MSETIWLNGEYVDGNKPLIHLNDRGWEYGAGVFDSMLVVNGKTISPELHINRLFRHCKALMGFEPWISREQWQGIVRTVLEENDVSDGHYVLKTLISEGLGQRGLLTPDNQKATILIRLIPTQLQENFEPAKLIIAQTRRNEGSIHSRVKSLSYIENILARKEAEAAGADDAIMLNNEGNITCATTSNIFVLKGGRFYTPPQSDGVNDGTIREKMLNQNHYPIEEKSLTSEELSGADGVFMSNTVMGLRPVLSIDGKNLPIAELAIPKDFHLS